MIQQTRDEIEESATRDAFNLCVNFLTTAGHTDAAIALTKFLTEDPAPEIDQEVEIAQPQIDQFNAQQLGFTGNTCPECGSLQMVRNGSCEKCNTCGATTGCS